MRNKNNNNIFNTAILDIIPERNQRNLCCLHSVDSARMLNVNNANYVDLRVYSHQESLLVHLLWSGPNTILIFFFGAVRFHTALFASEPETKPHVC